MESKPSSDERAGQAITRLIDGALSKAEREGVEVWAAANPDVMRQVHAQRRVAQAFATAGPATPAGLLEAIDQRFAAAGRDRTRPDRAVRAPRLTQRRWIPSVAVAALAAAAVAVVAVGAGGSGVKPSVDAAAKLAFVQATGPAPSVATARFLDVSYRGVTFPNYASLDAVATGELTGRVGGRPADTVFYHLRNGARLSYTVFSGRPVPLPAAARLVRYDGVGLRVYRMRDGLSVVTLVRSDRTCVLAARTVEDVVLGLAAEPVQSEHAQGSV